MAIDIGKSPHYAQAFRQSLTVMMTHCLEQVRSIESVPPIEIREQATHILTFALKDTENWSTTKELLLTLAPKMEQAGHRDDWILYLEQSRELSIQVGDPCTGAELSLIIGFHHQLKGEYDLAKTHVKVGLDNFRVLHNRPGVLRAQARLAYIEYLHQDHEKAIELIDEILDDPMLNDDVLGFCLLTKGLLFAERGRHEESITILKKSVSLIDENKQPRIAAKRLMSLGVALYKSKQYMDALVKFETARNLFEQVGDIVEYSIAQLNVGAVYLAQELFPQSLQILTDAEKVLNPVQDSRHLAMLHNNKGYAYYKLSRWADAENAYIESLFYWRKVGDINSCVETYTDYVDVYVVQDRIDQAISVLQEALGYLDSQELPQDRCECYAMQLNNRILALQRM